MLAGSHEEANRISVSLQPVLQYCSCTHQTATMVLQVLLLDELTTFLDSADQQGVLKAVRGLVGSQGSETVTALWVRASCCCILPPAQDASALVVSIPLVALPVLYAVA